jgi:septum formation protein
MIFNRKILLGSGSPRRKFLLGELGFDFRTLVANTPEIPPPGIYRDKISECLALEKATALESFLVNDEILVTADTIVWLENEMLGKPAGEDMAMQMLSKMNGKMHNVYTSVCITDKKRSELFSVRSDVYFRNTSGHDLKKYIKLFKPFDKAGAYGAQECFPSGINPCSQDEKKFIDDNKLYGLLPGDGPVNGIPLIEKIEGSYFNVMGLPIVELTRCLQKFAR